MRMAERRPSKLIAAEFLSFPKEFLDNYECYPRIGKGSFGTVYKCKHRQSHKIYAAKVITVCRVPRDSLNNVGHEVSVLSRLNNSNVLKIHRYFDSPGHKIMILSHLPDADLLPQRLAKKQFLSESEVAALLWGVANGLAEAHKHHVVHRDIKPANLFVKDPNDLRSIQIGDFGLSKLSKTRLKKPCGTIMYMAPEFFKDIISYGPPIDIWALATTALYLFVGHHPFHTFAKMNLDTILNNNELASKITNFSLSVKGYKYYTKLSAGLQSLLSGMFDESQNKRTTATQVLQHPFIIRCTLPNSPKHTKNEKKVVTGRGLFLPTKSPDLNQQTDRKQLFKDLFTPALGDAFSSRARRNTRHIVSEMKLLQGWRNGCVNDRRGRRRLRTKNHRRGRTDNLPWGMTSDAFIKEFNEDSALLSNIRASWRASHAFLSPKEFKEVFKNYSKGGIMKCADFANFVESECKAGDKSFGLQESKRVYKLGDINGKGFLDFADFSRFFAPSESSQGSTAMQTNHAPKRMSPLEKQITPPPATLSPLEKQITPPSNSPFERAHSSSTNITIPAPRGRSNNFKPDLTSQEPSAPAKGNFERNISDSSTAGKASGRIKSERKEKEATTSPRAKKMKTVDAKATKLPAAADVESFESEFCDRLSTLLSQHVVVSANLQKGLRREATFWKQRLFGVRDAPAVTTAPVVPSEGVLLSEKNKLPKL